MKRWPEIVWGTVFLSLNLSVILPLYWGQALPSDPDRSELSLLVFNVNHRNPNPAKVAAYIAEKDADVVVILEATEDIEDEMSAALGDYEKLGRSLWHAFGMLIYSRLPITGSEELFFADSELLTIALSVTKNGETFSILGLHTMPPVGRENSLLRDRMLAEAKAWAMEAVNPIIVGDFNATPWSHAYRKLVDGPLHNSQIGFGLQTSWPNGLWPLSIPIDHAVLGKTLTTTERSVGPFLGSDHRPIILRVGFTRSRSPTVRLAN
ncbi:MAG: endonuclease/exonuclease/phosphatase family protein [Kofleriaceae bacterium]|nr:endonuclease/exonuclease/phosphatase family protein [Kofleriaceae bacterium]